VYVNIGGDISVPSGSVSVIINLETVPASDRKVTDFIKSEDDSNRLQYLTSDIPRTLIVTDTKSYISSISSAVLAKRLEHNSYNSVKN